MANAKRPRPGRPDRGIRRDYLKTEVYLPRDLRAALDRLADREQQRTGRTVTRSDIMRKALQTFWRARGCNSPHVITPGWFVGGQGAGAPSMPSQPHRMPQDARSARAPGP
jgi:hypothetical protein